LNLGEIPYVIQINKTDLPDALPAEMIKQVLAPKGDIQFFEAVAQEFKGVREPLRAVSQLVFEKLAQKA